MKRETVKSFFSKTLIFQILFFVAALFLTIYFFPREEKFRYHFQEGKPWKYGLLTASFDFPIYKSQEQIKKEQDSILQQFQPFYVENASIGKQQIAKFQQAYKNDLKDRLPHHLYNYTITALDNIYKQGIISSGEYDKLQKEHIENIRILNNNIAREYQVSQLRSPRTAYEQIINSLPDEASKDLLRTCNLNTYLVENMVFDSTTTKKIRYELLQRISASSGIVQAGERIIDRGEIVSPHTYLILKSLETVTLKKKINMDRRETTLIGQAIVITCLFTFFYLFLALFRSRIFKDIRSLGFLMLMIVCVTLTAYMMTQTQTTRHISRPVCHVTAHSRYIPRFANSIICASGHCPIMRIRSTVPIRIHILANHSGYDSNRQSQRISKKISIGALCYTRIHSLLCKLCRLYITYRRGLE